jgi:hypothetical protein
VRNAHPPPASQHHNYSLKKVITEFAIKEARFHAAVLESSEVIHRDRDRSGQVFLINLFLRGLFGDPS